MYVSNVLLKDIAWFERLNPLLPYMWSLVLFLLLTRFGIPAHDFVIRFDVLWLPWHPREGNILGERLLLADELVHHTQSLRIIFLCL